MTSVPRSEETEDMDVDNNFVLIKNSNKNESAKLTFFASIAQSSIGVSGITVVENTGEEGGARYKATPSTLSEKPSSPRLALGSDDKREEGPTGSHLWEVVDYTHMSVDQYRKAEGTGDIEQGELGAADRETFAPTFPEKEGAGVTSSESSIERKTYCRKTSKEYARVGTASGAPAGTGAGGASGGGGGKVPPWLHTSLKEINE
jgi:hypothetical protein